MKFAIVGLGFISQRHLDAIKAIGGEIVCACDTDVNQSKWDKMKGTYARWFYDFDKMIKSKEFEKADYLVILTPNFEHFKMITYARQLGKKVICEKPLVLTMSQLEMMKDDKEIFTTLQLRYAFPIIKKMKTIYERNEIRMNIEVHRGEWYYDSWKVALEKSGGIVFNIGIHYFDLLDSEFGPFRVREVSYYDDKHNEGMMESSKAIVRWKLRIDAPYNDQRREIRFGEGHRIDLTGYTYGMSRTEVDFENLHTKVYEDIMKGNGIRPADLIRVTKLVSTITDTALEGRRRSQECLKQL